MTLRETATEQQEDNDRWLHTRLVNGGERVPWAGTPFMKEGPWGEEVSVDDLRRAHGPGEYPKVPRHMVKAREVYVLGEKKGALPRLAPLFGPTLSKVGLDTASARSREPVRESWHARRHGKRLRA